MAEIKYDILLNFITKMDNSSTKQITNVTKKQTEKLKKAMSGSTFTDSFFGTKDMKMTSKQISEISKQFDTLLPKNPDTSQFNWVNDLEKKMPKVGKMIDKSIQPTVALKQAFSKMIDLERFKVMGGDLKDYEEQMMKVQSTVNNLGGNFGKMSVSAKKMSRGFDMSMLSIMFFGATIQKTFLGMYNSMLNTFKMLDKKGIMPLNRSLTKMEAAFTFLSFSIMKSMEPILLPIIDAVVGLVDWFSQLPEPVLQAIGVFLLLGVAVGTLLLLIGTVSLGIGGLAGLFAGFSVAGFLAAILPAIAIGAVFLYMWETNFLGFRDQADETMLKMNEFTSSILLNFNNAAQGFALLIASLKEGDLEGWAQGTGLMISNTFAVILKEIALMVDGFIQGIFDTIGSVLKMINGIANALGGGVDAKIFNQTTDAVSSGYMDQLGLGSKLTETYANIDSMLNTQFKALETKSTETAIASVENYASAVEANKPLITQSFANVYGTALEELATAVNEKSITIGTDSDTKFAEGIDSNAQLMKDTVDTQYSDVMDLMSEITNSSINLQISDINRLIAKLKELESARAKANVGSSAVSTTNNNKSVTVNVSGKDNSKLVSDIKRAVA